MAEFMYADRIPAEILAWGNELAQIRRDIHQHPELGFDTSRTCGVIATKLSEWGVEFDDKLVEGGVIAVVNGNAPGPTVALRADMDALAMPDESENAWRSETSQRCHACGHDGHQAAAIGLAKFIHANAERLCGRIRFICQPAEEGSRGAYPILQAGVLDDVDMIICGHIAPELELGTVVAAPRRLLSTTKIDFEFTGRASHAGSHPQTGRNALLAGAAASLAIMALPRHADGMTRVNVGQLHAGEGRNIVPSHAWMEVEVRGETGEINRDLTAEALTRAQGAAMSFGVECRKRIVGEAIDYQPEASTTQLLTVCARRARGCSKVLPTWNCDYSDDGTLLIRRVQEQGGKGGYFLVGGALSSSALKPAVDFDEAAVITLYDTWANLITAVLGNWR